MSSLAKTAYFWRSALGGIRQSPFVHFVAVTTIAIALFTAGVARSASRLIEAVIARLGGEVELTAYLRPEGLAVQAEELAALLAVRTGGAATVVTPEAALQRLAVELGEAGAALANADSSPLPLSVELRVPESRRDPDSLHRLSTEVERLPYVAEVEYGREAVERLSAISRVLRYGGGVGFMVVLFATVVIVAATLQLAIYARREEIEIQKLVGATDRFVKAPFLIEGVIQGVMGATVATLALFGFAHFLAPRFETFAAFLLGPHAGVRLLEWSTPLELVGMGAALGLCGSFVAVGRFLKV